MLSRHTIPRLAVVALLGTATACIFDSGGDYEGGGRRDVGSSQGGGDDEGEGSFVIGEPDTGSAEPEVDSGATILFPDAATD